jgi:hypothetical protein
LPLAFFPFFFDFFAFAVPAGAGASRKPSKMEVRTPEIHKVDPEYGSTLRLLQGFPVKPLGEPANFGVSPVDFTSEVARGARGPRLGHGGLEPAIHRG